LAWVVILTKIIIKTSQTFFNISARYLSLLSRTNFSLVNTPWILNN